MKAKTNPYDWINPVVHQALFAGRREELAIIDEQIARLAAADPILPMVAVIGERRVGKTSVLRRVEELCRSHGLLAVLLSLGATIAGNSWEFWHEVLSRLLIAAHEAGICVPPNTGEYIGFRTPAREMTDQVPRSVIGDLWFPQAYVMYLSTSSPSRVADYVVRHDMMVINDALLEAGYHGLVLILDEAHFLANAQETKRQIRHVVQEVGRCGVVFGGESALGGLFTDSSEPFFGQARVVPLGNFTNTADVAECALLPLPGDERTLVSPMTIDYLARLSHGKPNQIRLIAYCIYDRYIKGEQSDLDITMDVLDNVIDLVQETFQEGELRKLVDAIRGLDSVDLELLYDMTRYRDWTVTDVLDLDESFRGEAKSPLAIARRERNLRERQAKFIQLGLMVDEPDCFSLTGGEFLHLYLRFHYEVRKYGRLSRRLVLGKPPSTPFGEKTEKLVTSVAHALGESPEVGRYIFHAYYRDEGNVVETVKRRFFILDSVMKGDHPSPEDMLELMSECLDVCELIGKSGLYYLLCLSVRNLDSPRELMQVELYFDSKQLRTVNLSSLFNILNQQAHDAKLLVDGYDGFLVELPELEGLLNAVGVPSLEDLTTTLGMVDQWRLASVRRVVHSAQAQRESPTNGDRDEEIQKSTEWIDLYTAGSPVQAEECVSTKLNEARARYVQARLYNDRGYIRYAAKLNKVDLAVRDLETAIHLHHYHLPLSLLNLAYIDIDRQDYELGIKKIEDALLLTFSRVEIEASYLRLRLPESHLNLRVKWEQHPANVLETSYINLSYAVLKARSYQEALDVLQEASQLLPSSVRLKHALARMYLFGNRADLANPLYRELHEMPSLPDQGITMEIRQLGRRIMPAGRKKRRKR